MTALKLHAHPMHYAHKLKQDTHLKKQALKALQGQLVWSRGLPAILQIPTSYLFYW